MNTEKNADEQLWEIAKKRSAFKKNLLVYVLVNLLLWGLWFTKSFFDDEYHYPWPIWVSLGWGLGIAFHYGEAYLFPKNISVEKEYKKLVNEKLNK